MYQNFAIFVILCDFCDVLRYFVSFKVIFVISYEFVVNLIIFMIFVIFVIEINK